MKKSTAPQKDTNQQYGVIIPVMNDQISITQKAFIEFAQKNPTVLISFIIDESSKKTLPIIKNIQLVCPDNIIVNAYKTLKDKVEAIRQGMLFMYNYTNVVSIGFLDPTIDISLDNYLSIAKYKEQFPEFGIAIGSRIPFVNKEYEKINISKPNLFLNKLYQLFDRTVLKTGFEDIFCDTKLFNRNLIPFLFDAPFLDKNLFEFELLLRLQRKFGKSSVQHGIVEFPIFKWNDNQIETATLTQTAQLPLKLFNLYFEYSLSISIKNTIERVRKSFKLNGNFNYEKSLSIN